LFKIRKPEYFMQSETQKTLHEQIVIFLDVLGFKQLVLEASKDDSKAAALDKALTKIDELNLGGVIGGTVNIVIFSDSIIISFDPDLVILQQVIDRLCMAVWDLMVEGIFMRGGISKGLLSTRSQRPWGPAFINAYETETNLAVHPRIVLSKSFMNWMKTHENWGNCFQPNCHPAFAFYKRDEKDGVYFIDVVARGLFKITKQSFTYGTEQGLKKIKAHLDFGIEQAITNPRVYAKYKWLCREWDRSLAYQQSANPYLEPFYTNVRQMSAGDFSIATLPKLPEA